MNTWADLLTKEERLISDMRGQVLLPTNKANLKVNTNDFIDSKYLLDANKAYIAYIIVLNYDNTFSNGMIGIAR